MMDSRRTSSKTDLRVGVGVERLRGSVFGSVDAAGRSSWFYAKTQNKKKQNNKKISLWFKMWRFVELRTSEEKVENFNTHLNFTRERNDLRRSDALEAKAGPGSVCAVQQVQRSRVRTGGLSGCSLTERAGCARQCPRDRCAHHLPRAVFVGSGWKLSRRIFLSLQNK